MSDRIINLEQRVVENEKVMDQVWQFNRLVCRMFTAYLAGDQKSLKELLVMAVEGGVIKFNTKWTQEKGGNEALIKLQEDLNKHYKGNQLLVEFQERVSAGFHVSPPGVEVKGREGGSSRPAPAPKKNDEPEMGR